VPRVLGEDLLDTGEGAGEHPRLGNNWEDGKYLHFNKSPSIKKKQTNKN
jgi:hypothetical protein